MFMPGNIVYHDKLIFNDNSIDRKKKRPCVVLYSININDIEFICTCPLTSQIRTFNKHPKNYTLIKEVVYNYKKLNFANISNIGLHSSKNTHYTNINVDDLTVSNIRKRLKQYDGDGIKSLEKIKEYLEKVELEEETKDKEQKRLNKKLRKENRRMQKQNIKI